MPDSYPSAQCLYDQVLHIPGGSNCGGLNMKTMTSIPIGLDTSFDQVLSHCLNEPSKRSAILGPACLPRTSRYANIADTGHRSEGTLPESDRTRGLGCGGL